LLNVPTHIIILIEASLSNRHGFRSILFYLILYILDIWFFKSWWQKMAMGFFITQRYLDAQISIFLWLLCLGNAAVGFLNGKSSQCIEKDVTLLFILIGCTRTKTFSVCMAQYSKVSIENCKTLFHWSEEGKLLLCSSKLFYFEDFCKRHPPGVER
jgi:hypothetical protein